MVNNEQTIYTCLQHISNTLLINGGFLPNLGLYTGNMGLVLFFYRYARLTQNEIYAEYGSHLLEKIQNKIRENTPLNYKHGLAGIGSTVEYLTQYGYIKINTDDLLEEFDKRIFFTFNLSYLSIDKITDIVYYVSWRLAGNSLVKDRIIKSVVPQIINLMEEWEMSQNRTHPAISFFKDIISSKKSAAPHGGSIISNWFQLCRNNSSVEELQGYALMASLTKFDLGIQNGLAGLGLSLISELDDDDSWFSLFPNNLIS
ncbi:MAG: hypothetical protein FWF52_02055 [Candidatus Azobacteroides sp.]|nr:hypothetical protein [Candidatus Azobacteroides sp.]